MNKRVSQSCPPSLGAFSKPAHTQYTDFTSSNKTTSKYCLKCGGIGNSGKRNVRGSRTGRCNRKDSSFKILWLETTDYKRTSFLDPGCHQKAAEEERLNEKMPKWSLAESHGVGKALQRNRTGKIDWWIDYQDVAHVSTEAEKKSGEKSQLKNILRSEEEGQHYLGKLRKTTKTILSREINSFQGLENRSKMEEQSLQLESLSRIKKKKEP